MDPVTPEIERWLTKAEAAAVLQRSTRAVERLAQQGAIEQRTEPPGPGRPHSTALYSESSIRSAIASPGAVAIRGSHARELDYIRSLAQPPAPPAPPRPWLSIAEASEYSGLPASLLEQLTRAATIHAIGRGENRRIQRASLDAFSSSTPPTPPQRRARKRRA